MTTGQPVLTDPSEIIAVLGRRARIESTIRRYAESLDALDRAGVESVFAPDVVARYGEHAQVVGREELMRFLDRAQDGFTWQHHLMEIYRIDASDVEAEVVVYLQSTQTGPAVSEPKEIAGRYDLRLRWTDEVGEWVVDRLTLTHRRIDQIRKEGRR